MAWQSVVAVDCSIIASIIEAVIHVKNERYKPTQWQTTLLTIATALGFSLFNIFAAGHLSLLEGIFAICHVFLFVPVVIMLWMLAPSSSAQVALFEFKNGGKWPSETLSVLVGQVAMVFIVLGSDSVAHLAEEVEDAAHIVPRSMLWSYIINAPMTLIMMLTLVFHIGDASEALRSPYPFVMMFENALRSVEGTVAYTVIMLVLLAMITVSAVASTSRQTFAFARDNGLPFSRWIKRVSVKLQVPVNAILVTAGFTSLLSLINLGSTAAFNAVLSLFTTGLMASYIISIGCVTRKRLLNQPLPHAPWSLGSYGLPINIIGLCYATWAFFWSFWPGEYYVTIENMNWALLIFVAFMGMACVMFKVNSVSAHERYEGPVSRVQTWMNDWR